MALIITGNSITTYLNIYFMHHYTQLYNCLDRKADILKKFCVPVSTGTSKGNKLLKLPSDSISDSVIFQNIMRAMPPDPLVLACKMPVCFTHYESTYPPSPTSTIMTDLAVPPFQNARSTLQINRCSK